MTAGSWGTASAVTAAEQAAAKPKATMADLLAGRTPGGNLHRQLAAVRRPSVESASATQSCDGSDDPCSGYYPASTPDQLQRLRMPLVPALKGFATAVDVINTRKSVVATIAGMTVTPAALAQQAVGRRGNIVGPQVIGLMDSTNPARPDEVREGQTMSLADNARAQKSSERTLCRQMAQQASAVVEAASSAASDR